MPGVQEARSFGRLFSTTGVRGSAVLQGRSSEVSCSDVQGVLRGSGVSEVSCAGGWEFLSSSQVRDSGRSRSSSLALRAFECQDASDAISSEGEVNGGLPGGWMMTVHGVIFFGFQDFGGRKETVP